MILAAHPPTYLPSPAVFYKMARADVFVLADDIQYSTHANYNRARIKTADGSRWLTVPVLSRGRQGQRFNEVEIIETGSWRSTHLRTLELNYCRAAYYEKYIDFFEGLYRKRWRRLAELNIHIIEFLDAALNLTTPLVRSSALGIRETSTDRIIRLAERLGCDTYLTEHHFLPFLNEARFREAGVRLEVFHYSTPTYHQLYGEFLPDLSIVDALFNEGENTSRILRLVLVAP